MGAWSFPGVKRDRGVTLTLHPLLVPWSRKSRAIPLLPLWAVRPVQSLSACRRVHFTFTYFFSNFSSPIFLDAYFSTLYSVIQGFRFKKFGLRRGIGCSCLHAGPTHSTLAAFMASPTHRLNRGHLWLVGLARIISTNIKDTSPHVIRVSMLI